MEDQRMYISTAPVHEAEVRRNNTWKLKTDGWYICVELLSWKCVCISLFFLLLIKITANLLPFSSKKKVDISCLFTKLIFQCHRYAVSIMLLNLMLFMAGSFGHAMLEKWERMGMKRAVGERQWERWFFGCQVLVLARSIGISVPAATALIWAPLPISEPAEGRFVHELAHCLPISQLFNCSEDWTRRVQTAFFYNTGTLSMSVPSFERGTHQSHPVKTWNDWHNQSCSPIQ